MATTVLPPFGEITRSTPATATSGSLSVKEWGGDSLRITEVTVSALPLVTPAGAAPLAGGHLLTTLPAGNICIKSCVMNLNLLEASGSTNAAKTPDLGVGTSVGAGANATLNAVDSGKAENIMTGQTASALNATTRTINSVNTILAIPSANAHTIYLNCADTWAGAGGAVIADGKVVIEWCFLD